MHPDDNKDSSLPGPAMVLVILASVAAIIILAGYQAGQMLAWLYKLLTA